MIQRFKKGERKPRREKAFIPRKRVCRFCVDKVKRLDYKEVKRLEAFIKERGKMLSPRISGNCAKHQRMLARAIRKARFLALLPYVRL